MGRNNTSGNEGNKTASVNLDNFGNGKITDTDNREENNEVGSGNDYGNSTILEPAPNQKRGRGRPTGSKNKNSANKETISLQDEEVRFDKDANVNANSKVKTKKSNAKLLSEEEVNNTSQFILTTIQTLAIQMVGNEAAFNNIETMLLSISLPQYLATLEVSTIDKTTKLLYPIALLAGFGMYGLRISNVVLEKRKAEAIKRKENLSNNTEYYNEGKTEVKDNTSNNNSGFSVDSIYNGINQQKQTTEDINWRKDKLYTSELIRKL